MNFLPIKMGIVREGAGSAPLDEKAEARLAELRPKVFERDSHTCQFCGFSSPRYQDVHFLNGNHQDIRLENLVTSCIFCGQCFDLEKTAQMNSGVLIWLPEIDQPSLNHLARALYIARISQGSMADAARSALEALMARREDAKNRIGTDDPFVLATVMRDFLGASHYDASAEKLAGVRLFPLDRRNISEGQLKFNQFPQILAYWRSKDGPFAPFPPGQWKDIYAKAKIAA